MARMYVNFKINAPDTAAGKPTLQMEHINFRAKDGSLITVGCDGDADFGVENGEYDARYKGLEYKIEDREGKELLEYGDEPSDDQLKALMEAEPESILFYWEEGFNVPDDFIPKPKDIGISISHSTKECDYAIEHFASTLPLE